VLGHFLGMLELLVDRRRWRVVCGASRLSPAGGGAAPRVAY